MEVLYTERLMLRPFEERDYDDVLRIVSDEDTVRYMYYWGRPGSTPESDAKRFIYEHAIAGWQAEPVRMREFALVLRGTDTVIGDASIEYIDDRRAEIGWILDKAYRGQGYATEAGERLLRFGFEELGFTGIIACCDERNTASSDVMKRLGMRLYQLNVGARPAKLDGICGNEAIYMLDKSAWWWRTYGGDSYVKKARSKLGHDLLVFAGACAFVVKDGKMLLQKRRDDGKWSNHGGCVEPGEDTRETVIRELYEETGLRAKSLVLIGTYTGMDRFHTYPNGDMSWIIDTAYLCTDFEGKIKPQQSEVAGLAWFPLDLLPPQEEWENSIYTMLPDCLRLCK